MRWLVPLLVVLLACARSMPPTATLHDAQRVNLPLAELHEGRALLIRKCGGCHLTPQPRQYSASEWPQKIGEMAERAKLDPHQIVLLQRYLSTMTDR